MLQYKTQKQIWQSRLSSMLGERQGIAVSLEPGIFKSVTCEYAQKSLSLVPILASALARKEQASAISKQSDARLMPTLTLNPTVTHYIQSPDWQTTTDREETEYGIYLNLNMPLYQGGALQAQKRAAAAAQISADAAVDGARLSILEVLLESSSQRETLKFHRQALKDREEYSRQTRDLYQQQYLELGSRPLLDLLNAEQDIYQAQLDQVNIESDMSSLGLSCANAKGELRQLFNLPVNE
jgi:adhesin transport system outer membrane protein